MSIFLVKNGIFGGFLTIISFKQKMFRSHLYSLFFMYDWICKINNVCFGVSQHVQKTEFLPKYFGIVILH